MSVNSTEAFSGPYTATGAAQLFPFGFIAVDTSEVTLIADGAEQPVGTYAVSLQSDGTGTVSATLPVGAVVYVASAPSFEQTAQFARFAPYFPDALNPHLDRAAIRDIWLKGEVSRSIRTPLGEAGASLPGIAQRVGRVLGFDAAGDMVALTGTGADGALRSDLADPTLGGSLIVYRAEEQAPGSTVNTFRDVVRRQPLNLYDKIPRNLWAGVEAGTNTTDLTPYIVAAIGTGRGIVARKGRYRSKVNIEGGNGISIRGEGKQLTYFENVDNSPIFTLGSATPTAQTNHIVGFELEDLWLENRAPGTYGACDLLKLNGIGDGGQWQNDSHHFRNVWFFQGRDGVACYSRSIWNVFDGCNFTGCQRDGLHIETIGNVNQWQFNNRNIFKGNGRNGVFFKHDFVDLATGWTLDNISVEDSGYEAIRFTGGFGIQGFSLRGSTFENNARLLAAGASAAIGGIIRRKATIFCDMPYMAGFDINAVTFYNNGAGGSGGNPDQHIYVSAVDSTGAPIVVHAGAIANSRFLPTGTGTDVLWPVGLSYHANNVNSGVVLLDETRGSIDLRKFAGQDEITAQIQLNGVTAPPVGSARYIKQGKQVSMDVPPLTGTSNATTATIIGLPQAVWPAASKTVPCIVQDAAGGIQMGSATIMTDGTISLFKDVSGAPFSATGTKGVRLQTLTWTI